MLLAARISHASSTLKTFEMPGGADDFLHEKGAEAPLRNPANPCGVDTLTQ